MTTATEAPTLFGDDEFGPVRYQARIYFGLGLDERVKIGITARKNGRRGGEMHFTELCSVPGDRAVEAYYHAKYASERFGKSEWFDLSDQMALDLYGMCVEQGRTQSAEILRAIIYRRLRQRKHGGEAGSQPAA